MGIDDFLKQVQEDELEDRLAEQTKATPIDYAKMRGIRPQRVYYHLRRNSLTSSHCECGRRVIDIQEADGLFGFEKEPGNLYAEPEEEVDDEVHHNES